MKDAIQYKVTVEAVIRRVEKAGKEWQRTSDNPNDKYAYTPEIEKTVERSVKIFQQTLDHLELPALVAVVNKLPNRGAMIGGEVMAQNQFATAIGGRL